jgi:hypothetical protein
MSFDRHHHAELLDTPEQARPRRIPTFLSFAGAAGVVHPPQQRDAVLQLYAFTDGSKLARAHTRAILQVWEWAGDHDSAVLVITELFSNACAATPEDPVWVRVAWESDGVLLEVWDQSLLLPSTPHLPCADAENGRGNFVIEALTIRRGATVTDLLNGGGKVVWGVVPTTAREVAI